MPTAPKSALSYFYIPLAAFALGLLACFGMGGGFTGAVMTGLNSAFLGFVLSVLEISQSFDNATVNAKVLEPWNAFWRMVFVYPGIVVAVFGMRFVFPIAIVSATSGMNPWAVTHLAFTDPAQYAIRLTSVHDLVAAFGGTFLLMVALTFFIDREKDNHWIGPIESRLTSLGQIEAVQALIALSVLLATDVFLVPTAERLSFLTAGLLGLIVYISTRALGTMLGGGKVVRASIWGFLYLEILDASFSFDGVIGAFAITNYLPMIAIGLGVGALFVRSLTIRAVDRGTLSEYRYLENGAFWSVLSLAGIMFLSVRVDVPQVVTGLIGAGLIGAAFVTSLLTKETDEAAQAAA
jgi:hypothetical protein